MNASQPRRGGRQGAHDASATAPARAFLDLKGGKPKEIWTDAEKDLFDRSLACHWNTPIHVNGFVYGCSGRHSNEADIRCVELATGEVKWRKKRTKRCSLLLVDGHFDLARRVSAN